MADILRLAAAATRRLIVRNIRITLQQLVECSLKTYEAWRIDTVGQVKPDRPYGSLVPDAKSDGVDHVIKVLQIALTRAEGEAAEVPENVSGVVKNYAVNVIAQ